MERTLTAREKPCGFFGVAVMTAYLWQCVLEILLLACLISFAWAMRAFFVQPAGTTKGMRLTGTCGTISAVLHLVAIPMTKTIPMNRAVIAGVLYIAALALFWWAISANRKMPLSAIFSPDLPVHIVVHGPYRYIRHPLYTSYLTVWLAGWIATFAWWLLPTIAVMAAVYIRASSAEEAKFSQSGMADSYAGYRARTGRFLPAPWKSFAAARSGKSLSD